jgi:hypothetical protein
VKIHGLILIELLKILSLDDDRALLASAEADDHIGVHAAFVFVTCSLLLLHAAEFRMRTFVLVNRQYLYCCTSNLLARSCCNVMHDIGLSGLGQSALVASLLVSYSAVISVYRPDSVRIRERHGSGNNRIQRAMQDAHLRLAHPPAGRTFVCVSICTFICVSICTFVCIPTLAVPTEFSVCTFFVLVKRQYLYF